MADAIPFFRQAQGLYLRATASAASRISVLPYPMKPLQPSHNPTLRKFFFKSGDPRGLGEDHSTKRGASPEELPKPPARHQRPTSSL